MITTGTIDCQSKTANKSDCTGLTNKEAAMVISSLVKPDSSPAVREAVVMAIAELMRGPQLSSYTSSGGQIRG